MIRIEEGKIRSHVDQVVRESVEQTLNGLLQAEADELCGAKRYARSPERLDTRAGHYDRKLHTKAGEVTLQVPRLRNLPFETEIIERYRRRERVASRHDNLRSNHLRSRDTQRPTVHSWSASDRPPGSGSLGRRTPIVNSFAPSIRNSTTRTFGRR
ncbi:MAG TPA: transposase [Pirellulales bacterium]|nr:transposase [Pirellulales bacterium]